MKQKFRKPFTQPEQEDFIKRVDVEYTVCLQSVSHFKANIFGGNVILRAGQPDQAMMRVQWKQDSLHTASKLFVKNNTLHLESRGVRHFFRQKNAYIIEVTLPAAIAISVKMFVGTLFLDGFTNSLDVAMKFGTVEGNIPVISAYIKLIAGSIKLHHTRGSVHARLKMGDIEIVSDHLERSDLVDVYCTMGDVKVQFPPDFLISSQGNNYTNKAGAQITIGVGMGDCAVY